MVQCVKYTTASREDCLMQEEKEQIIDTEGLHTPQLKAASQILVVESCMQYSRVASLHMNLGCKKIEAGREKLKYAECRLH